MTQPSTSRALTEARGFINPISVQTSAYTLQSSDLATTIEINSSTPVTFTVPTNASQNFPVGGWIDIVQVGQGQITFVANSGVTLRAPMGTRSNGAFTTARLRKRGTDEWVLTGNVTKLALSFTNAWRSALSLAGSQNPKVLIIGDSITEGQGASTRQSRWLDLFKSRTQQQHGGKAGRGYIPSWYAVYTSWAASDTVASTGTVSQQQYASFGYRTLQLSSGATQTWSFNGTDIDIWFTDGGNAADFTYSIDGATAVSVSTNTNYSTNNVVSISNLVSGPHTIKITAGSGVAYINGFMVWNNDRNSGVQVVDSAHFGYQANSFTNDSAGFAALTASWNTLAPDLAIIDLGTNEYIQGSTVASFQTNLTTIVTALQGMTKVPSVLLVASYQVADSAAPNRVSTYSTYVNAISAVASAKGCEFLDLTQVMPQADTTGNGIYVNDGVHPNDKGHAAIAAAIGPLLY